MNPNVPDEEPSTAFCREVADKLSNVEINGVDSNAPNSSVVLWVMYNEDDGWYTENRGVMFEDGGTNHYNNTSDAVEKVHNSVDTRISPEDVRRQILGLF